MGDHKVKLTLTDSAGKSITYDLLVTVTAPPAQGKKKEEQAWTPTYQLPPPQPKIQYVDMMGRVRVSFSRPIVVPTLAAYPEFKDSSNMRQNCTNGNEAACPKQIQRKLQTTVEQARREAVDIMNQGLVPVNKTMASVIKLDMVPGSSETNVTLIKQFTWECVDFTENYMDFQIQYEMFPEISIHPEKDLLQIDFVGREYFRTEDGQMITEASIKQQKVVPTQIDPQLGATMKEMGDTVGSVGKAMTISNFIIGIFLGGILSELLAAMNKLQIMLHLLIVNVLVPTHALLYF